MFTEVRAFNDEDLVVLVARYERTKKALLKKRTGAAKHLRWAVELRAEAKTAKVLHGSWCLCAPPRWPIAGFPPRHRPYASCNRGASAQPERRITGSHDARPTCWPPGPRRATGETDPRDAGRGVL
jgi:hypothetical protein